MVRLVGASIGGIVCVATFGIASLAVSAESWPLHFREIAVQGFGDRHNTKAWGMAWWKGRLYVGTARAHVCMAYGARHVATFGLTPYPPRVPELGCPPELADLPLRAEIWRFTPEGDLWERVFQSPEIPNPAVTGHLTARDAGIRNLAVFTDPDGEEALYAFAITSESIFHGMPPPRILRTSDGVNWLPVPQEPMTLLGDLGRRQANFRAVEVYKNRFYVVNGDLIGAGAVLEAHDPASGGDSFRRVTPPDMLVFEMAAYNGQLYLGLASAQGYVVVKTDAEGTPPYEFVPVVDRGGYARWPSRAPVSMYEYDERLYVGTDRPTELIRINPDDSWDLVVGRPRSTPDGRKEPLSGLGKGFDYALANHFHRMAQHQGSLYVSVNDGASVLRSLSFGAPLASEPDFDGFDLFASSDGVEFSPVSLSGFGSPRDNAVRVFASTPGSLFAGSVNAWDGLRIYSGVTKPAWATPPTHLEAERRLGGTLLSWEPVAGSTLYRIFRRNVRHGQSFNEIAATSDPFLVDTTGRFWATYQYYVVAESATGERTPPSNLCRVPLLRRPMTASLLDETTRQWTESTWLPVVSPALAAAGQQLRAGDVDSAVSTLLALKSRIAEKGEGIVGVPRWRVAELELLLDRLLRRARLADIGFLLPAELE